MADSLSPAQLRALTQAMRRLAGAIAGREGESEDVAQEAWVRVLEREADPEDPAAWLAGVTRNVAREQRRKAATHARLRDAAARAREARIEAQGLAELDAMVAVLNALRQLQPPYRSAITLQYIHGLPPHEAARLLDVPGPTFRTRVRRGLALLRTQLSGTSEHRRVLGPLLPAGAGAELGTSAIGGGLMGAKLSTTGVVGLLLLLIAVGSVAAVLQSAATDDEETYAPRTASTPAARHEDAPSLEGRAAGADPEVASAPVADLPSSETRRQVVVRLADGRPAAGLSYRLGGRVLTTDAEGRMTFDVRPGKRAEAWLYGTPDIVETGPVRLSADDATRLVRVESAASISGILTVRDGLTPDMYRVSGWWDHPHLERKLYSTVDVDADGAFQLRGLPRGRPIYIEARLQGEHSAAAYALLDLEGAPIEEYMWWKAAEPFEAPARDVSLDLRRRIARRVEFEFPVDAACVWQDEPHRPVHPRLARRQLEPDGEDAFETQVSGTGSMRIGWAHGSWPDEALHWELAKRIPAGHGRTIRVARPRVPLDASATGGSLEARGFTVGMRRERGEPSRDSLVSIPAWAPPLMDAEDRWWLYAFHEDGRYVLSRADEEGRLDLEPSPGFSVKLSLRDTDGTPVTEGGVGWIYDERMSRTFFFDNASAIRLSGLPPGIFRVSFKSGASSLFAELEAVDPRRADLVEVRLPTPLR